MRRAALATLSLVLLTASSALAQPALRSRFNIPNPFSIRNPPTVETMIPEDASAVLLVNTTDAVWSELHRFELFPRYMSVRGMMASVLGFDFDKDLRPWVGNKVAIALVPPQGQAASDVIAQPIVIATTKDDRRLWQFLDMAERRYQATSTERWYKRATIIEWQPLPQAAKGLPDSTTALAPATWHYRLLRSFDPNAMFAGSSPRAASFEPLPSIKPGLAFAVFDEHVVMAESAATLEAYIDNLPEEGSLLENPRFRQTMQQEPYERSFVVGHGNLGQLLLMVNAANQRLVASLPSESSPSESPSIAVPQLLPETLAQLKTTTDSVDAYLWAHRDGIQMRYIVHMDAPIAGLPTVTKTKSANQLLDRLPSGSYLSLNSANLTALWRLVLSGMEMQPSFAENLGEMRKTGLASVGLDDHDVFSWMDGEFALCLFPTRKGFLGSTIGVAFMVQTSDRDAAEGILKKLDAYAKESQIYSIKPRRFQGKPATSWDAVYAPDESLLAHSWLDDSTLLITNGTGPMAELLPQPATSLAEATSFQAAIAPLPKENAGYSYINMKATSNLMFNYILPQVASPETIAAPEMVAMRKTLATIRSVSAASSHYADRSQVDLFFSLTPTLPPRRR